MQPSQAESLPRPRLQLTNSLQSVREIGETILLIVVIYTLVNLASARFIVDGPSMQPNFETGQFVLVSRVNYLVSEPQRGDVVVFKYPGNPQEDYIKRVIGTPGDTVEIRDTLVYVNGVQLDEPYINEPCMPSRCPDNVWELGADEFFVMGDNRNHSSDSRAFGPVKRELIIGEALIRYWPPQDWGIIRAYNS
ncbi:MAG: signal peptidase I [Anaerolineae bacterium]